VIEGEVAEPKALEAGPDEATEPVSEPVSQDETEANH
jgi:hypothetical protein